MKRSFRAFSLMLAFILIISSVEIPAKADSFYDANFYDDCSDWEDISLNDSGDVSLSDYTETSEEFPEEGIVSNVPGKSDEENSSENNDGVSENNPGQDISDNDSDADVSDNNISEEEPGGEEFRKEITISGFRITFVTDEDTLCPENLRDVSENEEIGTLPVPEKEGYTFKHWYISGEEQTPILKTMAVTSDLTLYALFEANEYTVSFDANTGIPVDSKKVIFDVSYGELPVTSGAAGDFIGWFTRKDGGEEICAESIVKTAENHTLYAHWNYKYTTLAPMFSIASESEVPAGTRLYLSCTTSGAKIYYTLDGSEPSISEECLYKDVIVITEAVTVRAFAVRDGYGRSEVASSYYTIKDESNVWGDIREEDRGMYENADYVPNSLWVVGIKDADFTGNSIVQNDLRVYYHKTLLVKNKDYSVKYSSNKNAGTATATISGKGNYSGSIKKYYKIRPLILGDVSGNNENISIPDISKSYNRKVQKGTTTVSYKIADMWVALKSGTDFTYSYSKAFDYKNVGMHTVTIVGKGNYSGTATFSEEIIGTNSGKKLITSLKFPKIANIYADGSQQTPAVELTDNGYPLVLDSGDGSGDYTLEYQNNIKPGTATIIVRGIGNYTGTKRLTFKIVAIPMSKVTVKGITSQNYTGAATVQEAYVLSYKAGKNAEPMYLEENTDFIVSYSNQVNAGKSATVIFTGINRFSGTLKKTYVINARSISDNEITPSEIGEVNYVKNGATPDVVVRDGEKILVKGKDYTLAYSNNKVKNDGTNPKKIPTVTIKGKGNYKGTAHRYFTITGSSLTYARMTASDITYAAKAGICKPTIALYDANNAKLTAGTDYDKYNISYEYVADTLVTHIDKTKHVSYEIKHENTAVDLKNDVIPVGTEIRVTVHGKGNYAGSSQSTVFRYVQANLSKASVKIATQYYTGKLIELSKADITVTINKKKLDWTDYEIIGYSNNIAKGTAYVTLKGTGNYGGTKKCSFKISAKSMLYTIKYNNNKDFMTDVKPVKIVSSGTMKNSSLAEGSKLAANAYKITGYTFAGWNTQPDGSGADYTNQEKFKQKEYENGVLTYGSEVTLYAQWTATKYTIKYSCGYGITAKNNPSWYTIEDEVEFADPDEGYYTFYGWFKDTKYKYVRTGIALGTTGNIVIYGKVTPYRYTIKFDANGASGSMSPMKDLACGNTYTLTACGFSKTNYFFVCWNTKKDGTGTTYSDRKKVKNLCTVNGASITLYAQWEAYSEQKIWDTLMDEIGNPYGVAGLMGNLYVESGLRSNNLQNSYNTKFGLSDEEYTERVDNGSYTNFVHDSAGYGLAQWTYWSRKQNLYYYAKSRGKSIGDPGMQVGFLIEELKTSYPSVYRTLCTASSVREASTEVLLHFEKPRNQGQDVQDNRARISQNFYDTYAHGSSVPSAPFAVTITIKDLNIRSGPGTNYARVGVIAPGDYTIIQTSTGTGAVMGWGKLSNGQGWVSLDYCTIHK